MPSSSRATGFMRGSPGCSSRPGGGVERSGGERGEMISSADLGIFSAIIVTEHHHDAMIWNMTPNSNFYWRTAKTLARSQQDEFPAIPEAFAAEMEERRSGVHMLVGEEFDQVKKRWLRPTTKSFPMKRITETNKQHGVANSLYRSRIPQPISIFNYITRHSPQGAMNILRL